MKKIATTLFVMAFATLPLQAQEARTENASKTKIEQLTGKTGTIVKYTDIEMPGLKASFTGADTRVRRVETGGQTAYFFQIEKSSGLGSSAQTSISSIAYEDLVQAINAFKTLKADAEKDAAADPDYLENKYTTADGFQIGYYVSKGKVTWFFKPERSNDMMAFKTPEALETAFNEGKAKIEELKGKA